MQLLPGKTNKTSKILWRLQVPRHHYLLTPNDKKLVSFTFKLSSKYFLKRWQVWDSLLRERGEEKNFFLPICQLQTDGLEYLIIRNPPPPTTPQLFSWQFLMYFQENDRLLLSYFLKNKIPRSLGNLGT